MALASCLPGHSWGPFLPPKSSWSCAPRERGAGPTGTGNWALQSRELTQAPTCPRRSWPEVVSSSPGGRLWGSSSASVISFMHSLRPLTSRSASRTKTLRRERAQGAAGLGRTHGQMGGCTDTRTDSRTGRRTDAGCTSHQPRGPEQVSRLPGAALLTVAAAHVPYLLPPLGGVHVPRGSFRAFSEPLPHVTLGGASRPPAGRILRPLGRDQLSCKPSRLSPSPGGGFATEALWEDGFVETLSPSGFALSRNLDLN